ncbi:MAG: aldehyde ferredoxin oxidoreductase family protein [Polyangiaceae bacterium]
MAAGYFGRYLRVDLTTGLSTPVPIDEATLRHFIGGVGLGTVLLTRETNARFDPLGEESCVAFAFSPLVGTPITTSAKFAVVCKSPLTGRLNDALSSSDFAVLGKRSGHDAIVLRGRAEEPCIVLIDEDGARIEPGADLWGTEKGISQLDEQLRKRHPGFAFAIIGTAGEHGVRYATLSNGGRHAGRGGIGAVLGSMRVKAVGVRGRAPISLHAPNDVLEISRDLAKRSLGNATAKYRELGTVANLATFNRLAVLPTRNFQSSQFEGADALSGEQLQATRAQGRGSCRNCTIGCEHFFSARHGNETNRVKMEYESLFALGPLCGVDDPDAVLAASHLCDEFGLDTISAGGTIAFAMECAERGMLEAYGEESAIRFGDAEALLELLGHIARRDTPLGDLLADGSRRAADVIGGDAPDFAPHVKGMEIPGYEPRGLQTMALGFAVGTRGADHNRSGAYEVDFSGEVDRFAPNEHAARLAVQTENRASVIDSLILCKFLRGVFADTEGGLYAAASHMLRAVTGWAIDAAEVEVAAERICLAKKLFNIREGWSRSEDTLPKRFTEQALQDGPAKGAVVQMADLEKLIATYYETRGWRSDGSVSKEHIRTYALDREFASLS